MSLPLGDTQVSLYMTNAVRYRELVLNNLSSLKNPMWSIQQNGQWVIYYHIESWQGPVTALAITNMTAAYEAAVNDWLAPLADFDPAAPIRASVKVFGFVFNRGVTADSSFYNRYGNYPIVTNWDGTNESSPWLVRDRASGATSDQNWYNIVDFTTLEVAGNRTDGPADATFSPTNWSGYRHPEGVSMPLRSESVMYASDDIGDFDRVILRMIWETQKP